MERNWLIRHGWSFVLNSKEGINYCYKDNNAPVSLSKKEEFEMARFNFINGNGDREEVEKKLGALMEAFADNILSSDKLAYQWSIEINIMTGKVTLRRLRWNGKHYRDEEEIVFDFINDKTNRLELVERGIVTLHGNNFRKDIDILEKLFYELVG